MVATQAALWREGGLSGKSWYFGHNFLLTMGTFVEAAWEESPG